MNRRRFLPVLLLLFVGSGSAALVYEVVWFQLLQLVIGVSAISLGVLLGTFMGGLCLGSLLFPRLVPAGRHPLRVYALIEVAIGVIGLLVLVVVPLVAGVYTAWAGPGMVGLLMRAAAAGICLLPPTLLMGATLPALSRWVEIDAEGRVVARALLRRQYGRRGPRQPARRLLPASRVRRADGHLRGRRPERVWSR